MADEPQDDELLLEDRAEGDQGEDDQPHTDANDEPEGDEFEEEVTFGDGAAPAPGEGDTPLIQHMRKQLREAQKRAAELEKQVGSSQQELGPKPTLADCEYDEDRFDEERDAWEERRRAIEAAKTSPNNPQVQAREEWQRDHQSYQQQRAELTYADRDEVEGIAAAALSEVQQAVVVQSADNPALLLYALGRNPAKLAEISQIQNPLKMAAAIAKLEGALKVNRKRKAPDPERIERGSARVSVKGADKELQRLEKEAEQSGNYDKLFDYKRRLRSQGKL